MSSRRWLGSETSETRTQLLDVTEQLMVQESFAAVTSRRVAGLAGVNPALVHYYFPTLEDLFVQVYRRRSDRLVQHLHDLLDTDQPLWALWEFNAERDGTALVSEFLALANHRKGIQAEIAETAERLRKLQIDALTDVMGRYQIDTEELPPAAIVVLMVAVPRVIVIEEGLGLTTGHDEARDVVLRFLTRLEGPRRA